ncbi:MAG: glutamyl-tRNA reductase [Candidatus Helarchaeota archaeon]
MYLLNYRITHHRAKIHELESTRFKNVKEFYDLFNKNPNIKEAIILQTCNRNEFYFIAEDLSKATFEINRSIRFSEKFEIDRGISAINHLFEVASGIDSLVVGEDQILNQIKESFKIAGEKGAVGPILTHIFQKALSIGKKVRSQTEINNGAVSIGSIAVDYCKNNFRTLDDQVITVIGAGRIGTLVAKALLKYGVKATFVSNRTYERAVRLANELKGKALKLDQLDQALLKSNIVILATSAPHPILSKVLLEKIMKTRKDQELIIIDISVPRNIEPEIQIPNLKIYDLDELKIISKKNRAKRIDAIKEAKTVIQKAIKQEERYFRQQFVRPLIASIYSNAEEIRRNELQKLIKLLENPSPMDIKNLENFSQVLINKILANFSLTLKTSAESSLVSSIII